MSLKKTKRL